MLILALMANVIDCGSVNLRGKLLEKKQSIEIYVYRGNGL